MPAGMTWRHQMIKIRLGSVALLMATSLLWQVGHAAEWDELSPAQQQVLSGFSERWDGIPEERRERLSRGAQRWLEMEPDQKTAARERFRTWKSLDPEQKRRLRERYDRFRQLPPSEQARVRENFRRFNRLRELLAQHDEDADPVARPDAQGQQSPGQPFDLAQILAVGPANVLMAGHQGFPAWEAGGDGVEVVWKGDVDQGRILGAAEVTLAQPGLYVHRKAQFMGVLALL